MRAALLFLALVALLGPGAGLARAQDDPEMARARVAHELAGELMSPYCPNRTLADCPSPDAAVVRDEIREALRAGEAPEAIKSRIEARFGKAVIGLPQTSLGRALPIAVLVAGAAIAVYALRRLVR